MSPDETNQSRRRTAASRDPEQGTRTPQSAADEATSIDNRSQDPEATNVAATAYDSGGSQPSPGQPPNDGSDTDATRDLTGQRGRLLGGRYELSDVIGRGGMAEVRRAHDTRLGRRVAVKELRADLASDPTFQARFRREAQSAAGLNHPNIVAVYDTGEEYDPKTQLDIPYIVMELVEGHTLRDILRDGRKILPERALELVRGVLDALSYSHKAGIIHRDIKPANVMLTPQGNVKVMDFGIARAVSDVSSSMTQTAAVIGTAHYLSPEQARGETVDVRSDIYSAGCLLYELLAGRPPFVGDSPVAVAYQHVRELPVSPSQLDPVISPDIDAIVLTALAKDSSERYQSARAMADDIDRLLNGEGIAALTPVSAASAPEPTTTQVAPAAEDTIVPHDDDPQRRRALPVVVGFLSVILIGLLVAGLWWFNQDRAPAETPAPQVTVPNVVGQQRAAAETDMRTARLVPDVREIEGAGDNTVGSVVRQNPVAGGLLDPGGSVQLEVNVGPRQAVIPSGLTGRSAGEAERSLERAGFGDVRTAQADSEPPDARRNQVLAVSPAEGQEVALTTEIVLEVATGRSPVPNWVGWNQASVEQDRNTKGFTDVVFETRETSEPAQLGTVIAIEPAPGTQVDRTDRVVVLIGEAPALPTATPEASPTPTEEDDSGPTPTSPRPPTAATPTP